jgi:hypothetical protein
MSPEHRPVTIFLRLVVDQLGRLTHGEVVDLAGKTIARFADWRKLTPIVRTWLITQHQGELPKLPGDLEGPREE